MSYSKSPTCEGPRVSAYMDSKSDYLVEYMGFGKDIGRDYLMMKIVYMEIMKYERVVITI